MAILEDLYMFQFLVGTLKTWVYLLIYLQKIVFQFLVGTLKTQLFFQSKVIH